jgi:hypothetical protein
MVLDKSQFPKTDLSAGTNRSNIKACRGEPKMVTKKKEDLPEICKQCLRESEEVGKRFWKCYPNEEMIAHCPYPEYTQQRIKEEAES